MSKSIYVQGEFESGPLIYLKLDKDGVGSPIGAEMIRGGVLGSTSDNYVLPLKDVEKYIFEMIWGTPPEHFKSDEPYIDDKLFVENMLRDIRAVIRSSVNEGEIDFTEYVSLFSPLLSGLIDPGAGGGIVANQVEMTFKYYKVIDSKFYPVNMKVDGEERERSPSAKILIRIEVRPPDSSSESSNEDEEESNEESNEEADKEAQQ
jgi:hypothetical protein